jgi:tetratricopeptide (TPR) repeat protein
MDTIELEPPKGLLRKVMFVARAKTQLPLIEKGRLNSWGVYCRMNRLPDGTLLYQAGGKFVARLRFTVEKDGSTRVRKYQPGDWEHNLECTYDKAKFWVEGMRLYRELDENKIEVTGGIARLEELLNKNPNRAYAWAILYELCMGLERFKDAEKAATAAVKLNPQEALYHFNLSTLYYVAVTNSKVSQDSLDQFKLATSGLKIPPDLLPTRKQEELENRVRRLTLETLGCSYDYAHRMAVHHCSEALRLSKDREETRVASSQLANLRRLDQI